LFCLQLCCGHIFWFRLQQKTKGRSNVFLVFMRQTSTLSLFNSFLLGVRVHSQSVCGWQSLRLLLALAD
jgi:hypothetical protein